MQEVIRDDLLVDVIFWPSLFQYAQGLGEVLVEGDGLVAQFADEQVFFFDFFFKGERALELFLRGFDGGTRGGGGGFGGLDLFAEIGELGFVG